MKITMIIVWPNEMVTVTIIELEFLQAIRTLLDATKCVSIEITSNYHNLRITGKNVFTCHVYSHIGIDFFV